LVLGLVSSAPEPTAAAAPDTPALTPAPQSVQWTGPAVDLTGTVEIVKVGGGAGDVPRLGRGRQACARGKGGRDGRHAREHRRAGSCQPAEGL